MWLSFFFGDPCEEVGGVGAFTECGLHDLFLASHTALTLPLDDEALS